MKSKGLSANTIYIGLTILFVLFQFFFLTRVPDIMEDEPWYANTAYNFTMGNGFTNTNVGHQGGDNFIVYTFLLAIAMKIFGCTLFVTRSVSILAGVIALWGMISVLRNLKISKNLILMVILMFIFSNVIYIVFRTTRPESWILAFGIWSVYYLIKFNDSKQTNYLIMCAVFATLSFLTHPNGIVFPLISGIYLIFYSFREKNISNLLYFGLIVTAITLVHFVLVFLNPNIQFKSFIFDLKTRNSITDTSYTVGDNLIDFFTAYTLGIKRLFILIFEIGILIYGLFFSKHNKLVPFFAFFGLFNLTFSLLVFSPYSSRHFGEIILFTLISFALITQFTVNKKLKLLFILLGLLYLGNNVAGDLYILYTKQHNVPYSRIEKELIRIIPDNSVVMASLHFWYPFKTSEFYNEYTRWGLNKKYKSIDGLVESKAVDYVVINSALIEGKTGTSGRDEVVPTNVKQFYNKMTPYAAHEGEEIYEFRITKNDTLRVFKIKK